MMRKHWLLAGAFVLASCGSSTGSGSGVASINGPAGAGSEVQEDVDTEQAMLDFADCMAERGVDVDIVVGPDGNPGIAIQGGPGGEGGSGGAVQAGGFGEAENCRHHLEGVMGGFSEQDQSEMQDQVLEFIRCLRENGIDMDDPDLSGGRVMFQPPENATEAEMDAAVVACEEYRPGGGSGMTAGPAGGR